MNRTAALYAVTALAALSFAGQALAKGGGMGGSQGHGNSGGTHQMDSSMLSGSGDGNGMQQRSMPSEGSQQGSTTGSGSQSMTQGGPGASGGHRNGQMNANGTGRTTSQPPVTTATN